MPTANGRCPSGDQTIGGKRLQVGDDVPVASQYCLLLMLEVKGQHTVALRGILFILYFLLLLYALILITLWTLLTCQIHMVGTLLHVVRKSCKKRLFYIF